MNPKPRILSAVTQRLLVGVCAVMLVPGDSLAEIEHASLPQDKASASQNQGAKIPPDQLDSLVAPIALYPDPMLAQVLAVSTIRWRSFSSNNGQSRNDFLGVPGNGFPVSCSARRGRAGQVTCK